VRTWTLALLTLVAFVSGCGGQTGPSPLDRKAVTTAFRHVGEPLKLKRDVRVAGRDAPAPLDALYVPVSADVAHAPFQVAVYDDEEGALETAQWMLEVSGGELDIVRRKNVILNLISVTGARRDKLILAVASL